MENFYRKMSCLSIVIFFMLMFGNFTAQECTWKVKLTGSYGDQISWKLTDSNNQSLLTGGSYTYGFADEKTVNASGPLEFFIETEGEWQDNVVTYYISNNNGIIATGTLTPGQTKTESNLTCSSIALTPSQGCTGSYYGTSSNEIFVPACAGVNETITGGGKAGEYSSVQLQAGVTYTLASKFSFNTYPNATATNDFITVTDQSGSTVLASGTDTITYTPETSGVIRFYTHVDAYCNYSDVFRTRIIKCGDTPEPPQNPNYSCFQGDGLKSNGFENAFNIGDGSPYRNVDDFIVPEGSDFKLKYIRLNVASFSPITSAYFNIYEDGKNGGPTDNITITTPAYSIASQQLIGYNNIGFPVYQIDIILDSEISIGVGRHWLNPQLTTVTGQDSFWEMTSTGSTGDYVYSSYDNEPWSSDPRNYNAVFFVAGDCKTLSTSEASSAKELSVYPNPTVDVVNFKTNKPVTNVKVYNVAGQKVKEYTKVDENRVSLQGLAKGVYILEVNFKDGSANKSKVIKN